MNQVRTKPHYHKDTRLLKRCFSLKRNKTFRYVYRKGKSIPSKMLVMIYNKSKTGMVKVGFSVSKRIGNSVTRNRVKRRLREAFRPLIPEITPGYDIIFIARDAVKDAELTEIAGSMQSLLKRAGLTPAGGQGQCAPKKQK